MPNEFVIKNGLIVESGTTTVTGSVTATGGFTGSLFGTSSYALTASVLAGGALTNFIEGFSSATQATSFLSASNAATTVNIAIVTKGTGSLLAQVPDGTTTGGNARGANAIDFQKSRTNANQVASADNSVIIAGFQNRNASPGSFLGGGGQNLITANPAGGYDVLVGGLGNSILSGNGPHFLGGGIYNGISSFQQDSVLVGGRINVVNSSQAFLGGGYFNTVSGQYGVIGGGLSNTISGQYGTIGGGQSNTTAGLWSTVGGGFGCAASANGAYVGGGYDNDVTMAYSGIGAGEGNRVTGTNFYAWIGGGQSNQNFGQLGTISGGGSNSISAGSSGCTIGGGIQNIQFNTLRSTIGGGYLNSQNPGAGNDNEYNTIAGGYGNEQNTNQGSYQKIRGGFYARTTLYGQDAHASGRFSSTGDAQSHELIWRRAITGTAQTELFLDGTSIAAILPATNAIWHGTIDIAAICTTQGNGTTVVGDVEATTYKVTIKRLNTTTSLVGTVQEIGTTNADASMSTGVFTIDNNDTNESLRIQYTPPTTAGSTTVIRVVATFRGIQIQY